MSGKRNRGRLKNDAGEEARDLYLNLLKRVLTRYICPERYKPLSPRTRFKRAVSNITDKVLGPVNLKLVRQVDFDPKKREEGRDWPPEAETMIGLRRLDNLHHCIVDVLARNVPGDLIETGVWRGGASIFMRAVLKAYGITDRSVWAADSFAGFPPPDPDHFPADAADTLHTYDVLAIPIDEVKRNFDRYGLLDDQVRFLEGWFRDTLPTAPIEQLALMRLDSDLYESTIQSLNSLYSKLSIGGYVIVDDYGVHRGCKTAIDDFRREHDLDEPLAQIDRDAVYWQRQR